MYFRRCRECWNFNFQMSLSGYSDLWFFLLLHWPDVNGYWHRIIQPKDGKCMYRLVDQYWVSCALALKVTPPTDFSFLPLVSSVQDSVSSLFQTWAYSSSTPRDFSPGCRCKGGPPAATHSEAFSSWVPQAMHLVTWCLRPLMVERVEEGSTKRKEETNSIGTTAPAQLVSTTLNVGKSGIRKEETSSAGITARMAEKGAQFLSSILFITKENGE